LFINIPYRMRSIDFSAMGLGAWFDRRDVRLGSNAPV
jgi:hypothetical protein